MHDVFLIVLACMVLGAFAGVLAGLLGIGGGLIIVPVLLILFTDYLFISVELAMPIAVATSLSTVIFTGLSSAFTHYRLGNIDNSYLRYVLVGVSLGAVLGVVFAISISGLVLKLIFSVLMVLIALQMAFLSRPVSDAKMSNLRLLSIGGGTGFISALMGIGGGALLVPALLWHQVGIRKAIGCASLCGVFIALFASLTFIITGLNNPDLPPYSLGYVYLPACLGIVITSGFTASLGAKLSAKTDPQLLKKIFAVFLILMSIRMLMGLE